MPDHLHLLTDAPVKPSVVLQYIKGIVARRVIDHLKKGDYASSLRKLRHADWKRNHRFSLWQHDSDVFSVTSESKFIEKVNYIHMNPVRAGLVERAEAYRWSSARWWKGAPAEDEPLRLDLDKIVWRRSGKRSQRPTNWVSYAASPRLAAHRKVIDLQEFAGRLSASQRLAAHLGSKTMQGLRQV